MTCPVPETGHLTEVLVLGLICEPVILATMLAGMLPDLLCINPIKALECAAANRHRSTSNTTVVPSGLTHR
jgi:hypothetical protein